MDNAEELAAIALLVDPVRWRLYDYLRSSRGAVGRDEAAKAASFDNPDHVAIVVHNYRWRLELADGEAQYAELEQRLAQGPVIGVPTITLEGDANGAPHPDPASYAGKFTGTNSHRTIQGGIGHNLPQEAPEAFANAVLEVDAT
jgi:pimeloyl-ACP methyl ester carboxylesterase